MCGRLSTAELIPEDLKKLFALTSAPPFLQKYNIAPTLQIPAVLEPDFFDTWLDPGFKETHLLREVLSAPQEGALEMYPVSSYVSHAVHDGEQCIAPLQGEE